MTLLRQIAHLCVIMLFSVFGTNVALAVPMNTSEISFYPVENIHFKQAADVGFAARAPPIAVTDVAVTGGVTIKQGSAFALRGQDTVAALFGFSGDLNATNNVRTVDADLVSFGRNANQNHHTWRHIDDIGMDRTRVQNSVLDDIPADLPAGPHQRRITVDGVELEYRIFKFDDGSFNVGTIFDP